VRGVGYGVDAQEGVAAVAAVDVVGEGPDVGYRAEDVGGVGAGYEFCFGG